MPTTRRLRHATVVAAVVSATVAWAVVTQVAGVHLGVRFQHSFPTTVTLGTTAAATAGATLLGWGLLLALEKMTSHARRIWTTLAVAVFLASLALPIVWATTTAATFGLAAIHLVVASVALIGFTRAGPSREALSAAAVASPSRPKTVLRPHRWAGRLRPAFVALVALVVLGGTGATLAGTSSAGPTPSGATAAWATSIPVPTGAAPMSSGPRGAFGPGKWKSRALTARTEYFHVGSTNANGPGAIIMTGAVNAGGVEHPGRAIDGATFAGGGFRIDHSAGHPTIAFDPQTCVGTIDQTGPFSVIDGTGRFSALAGSGSYVFRAIYTTARGSGGCTEEMTAYLETIDGSVTFSASVSHNLEVAAG